MSAETRDISHHVERIGHHYDASHDTLNPIKAFWHRLWSEWHCEMLLRATEKLAKRHVLEPTDE